MEEFEKCWEGWERWKRRQREVRQAGDTQRGGWRRWQGRDDGKTRNETRHGQVGQIAAKYVETLQRSNEQLVKIAALIQKKTKSDVGLTENDKNEIFDLIKESG